MKERAQKRMSQNQELVILRKIAYITSEKMDLNWVLQEVVDIVSEATAADSVFIYLLDDRKEKLILKASQTPHQKEMNHIVLNVGEGITGWTAEKNELVVIKKNAYKDLRFKGFDVLPEDQYEAFLSVPISYKDNPIGVMNIQHKDPHNYPTRVIDLITTISRNVAGLIENARLYEDTKKKVKRFETLVQISESITSEQYLDDILNRVVRVTSQLLHSKICSLLLVNEETNTLILKSTQSLSEDYKKRPALDIDNSLSGTVLKSQKPLKVYDVRKEGRYHLQALAEKEHLTSLLIVPMIIKNKAMGVLNVYTNEPYDFTQDEIDTLQIIANQVAVTIENRRLLEENIKTKEALETRKLVERAKGILMQRHNIDEESAHRMLHKRSMDSCRSMKEIAEAIILTKDIGI